MGDTIVKGVGCWDDVEKIKGEGWDDDETTAEAVTEELALSVMTAYLGDAVFARRFLDCMNIIRAKNADYSQGEDKRDRIAAFRRIARDIEITMKQAWAVFAQKHWGAIMKFVKDGQVESEPIGGRINDMINYCVLLGAIVDEEHEGIEATRRFFEEK